MDFTNEKPTLVRWVIPTGQKNCVHNRCVSDDTDNDLWMGKHSLILIIVTTLQTLIGYPAFLRFYSRTPRGGRWHGTWARNRKWRGGVTPCFLFPTQEKLIVLQFASHVLYTSACISPATHLQMQSPLPATWLVQKRQHKRVWSLPFPKIWACQRSESIWWM